MVWSRRSSLAIALGILTLVATTAADASAQDANAPSGKYVTFAARTCASYADIYKNRNPNDLMESLSQLGPASPYGGQSGFEIFIRPQYEDIAPQDSCQPLKDWRFTLGTGITDAANGTNGYSIVTGAYGTVISTADSVPLRNDDASFKTPQVNLPGATTVELTNAQAERAKNSSELWLQAGTNAAPITDPVNYAFGALRCATDNYNGDNVEWIRIPTGLKHAFCYAYYVNPPPPGEGRITVVKEITGAPPQSPKQTVQFKGDLSFNPDGGFSMDVTPGAAGPDGTYSQRRAAGRPWRFQELLGAAVKFASLDCASSLAGQTANWSRADTGADPAPGAIVTLRPNEEVTCTFVNSYSPPESGMLLRKITRGGTGTFGFGITGAAQADLSITTAAPDLYAFADDAVTTALPPGAYTIEETPPDPTPAGRWSLTSASCGGATAAPRDNAIDVTLLVDAGAVCTFENTFTPGGRITIDKVTTGGTGTADFQVIPEFLDRVEYLQTATTSRPGEPARATGDSLRNLQLGTYVIQETMEGAGRLWRVNAVVCDDGTPEGDKAYSAIQGRVRVTLTEAHPRLDCRFVNELTGEEPPAPPPPGPPSEPIPPPTVVPEPPTGGVAGLDVRPAELRITKRARPRSLTVGDPVRYRVVVTNRGPAAAEGVTVGETIVATRRKLRLLPSRGRCKGTVPRSCVIGRLGPGKSVAVDVRLRTRRAGSFLNSVAVNSSTVQRTRRGKTARARVRIRALPQFTG